jgi:hypothetical protein
MDETLARVWDAYDADPEREWDRLGSGTQMLLEHRITRHALERHLPPPEGAPDAARAAGRGIDRTRRTPSD